MSLGGTIRRGAQEEGENVWARTKRIKQGGIVESQKSANLSEEALSCYMACDNKSKSSTNVSFPDIMVQDYGACNHDFCKESKVLGELSLVFSIIAFNMIKLLATIQVKAGNNMIKELYSAR